LELEVNSLTWQLSKVCHIKLNFIKSIETVKRWSSLVLFTRMQHISWDLSWSWCPNS
jgi:hypothetical protein